MERKRCWLGIVSFLLVLFSFSSFLSAKGLWECYKEGIEYKNRKEFTKAIEGFRKIIVEYPGSRKVVDVYFQIANCFYLCGETEKAIETYKKIIEKNKEKEEILSLALFGMGLSYEKNGNTKASRKIYETILRQYPDTPYIPYIKEKLAIKGVLGDKRINPAHKLYLSALVGKLEVLKSGVIRERFETAIKGYRILIEKYPSTRLAQECRMCIGNCFMAMKEYRKAINEYQIVLSEQKFKDVLPPAYLWLGWCEFHLYNYAQAEKAFQSIVKYYPHSPEIPAAYYGIGSVHKKIGDNYGGEGPYVKIFTEEYKKALQYFNRLIKEFPESNWTFKGQKNITVLDEKLRLLK